MMTFFDHLRELRSKILICVGAIAIGTAIAHVYHDEIIRLLLRPIGDKQLFFLSPLDPLFFVFKIDLCAGVIFALPVINWSILAFVRPAMKQANWWLFSIIYGAAGFLLLAGLAYAYFVTVPISLGFLLSISVAGIQSMITANSYLSFLLAQCFIIAIIFQMPLFIIAGTSIEAFKVDSLSSKRRHIYVGGLIALAVITPTTDIFNLCIVALPAWVIFEGSLVAARFASWYRHCKSLR